MSRRTAVALVVPDPYMRAEQQLDVLTAAAVDRRLEIVAVTREVRTALEMLTDGRALVVLAVHGDVLGQLVGDAGGELARVVPARNTRRLDRAATPLSPVPAADGRRRTSRVPR